MTQQHPTALIADDEPLARERLRSLLAAQDGVDVVAEAGNGEQALHACAELQPDLVLLDIAMPERDGLDVLQVIRRECPGLPVLMLSTYPEKQYAVRCIKLGAAGYLNKSADPDDMLAAIRKVAGGGVFVTPTTAEALAGLLLSRSRATRTLEVAS